MPVICYLILAHILIDWFWQGPYIAEHKQKSWVVMTAHVAGWSLGICAVLSYFGLFQWWKLIMLFSVHYLTDRWKGVQTARRDGADAEEPGDTLLLLDQAVHLVQLAACLF